MASSPHTVDVLLRDNFDFIWRLLRRLGVHADVVEDATQEVFMVAARKLSVIQSGSERSFLYGIALRTASDFRRAAARRMESAVGQESITNTASAMATPEQLTDQKQAREILDRILDAMEADVRAVFVLYELEELSTLEIAQCIGIPVGTVASRLRRGREEFQVLVKRTQRELS